MTKPQARKKVNELIRNLKPRLTELAYKAIESGAIDLSEFDNNYVAPKIIVGAVLDVAASEWIDFGKESKAARKNITHFI